MEKDYTTVASIQTFFDSILRGKLDDNVFFDAPPQTINDSWKSFVVVDLGTEKSDNNAMSRGTDRKMTYWRSMDPGNGKMYRRLKTQSDMKSIVKNVSDSHYVLDYLSSFSDYDTDTGFNVVISVLRIKIL